MKKNQSKRDDRQPIAQRLVEPKMDAAKSAPPLKPSWKPITLEDLNLTIEQMEVYAAACRPIFASRTCEEDDNQEPEQSESTDAQDWREKRQ